MAHMPLSQDHEFGCEVAEVHSIFEASDTLSRSPRHIALIGNFPPRKCGIATFTSDLYEQLGVFHPEIRVDLHALDERGSGFEYNGIAHRIDRADAESFAQCAKRINASAVDAVWLQHEYGIFGGADGDLVCAFVDRLAPPLILTLHTVLSEPSHRQQKILRHLVTRASRIMVMSCEARRLLLSEYGAPGQIVEVIDHGAPDRPFGRQMEFKERLDLGGRKVLMTFGLLGPGKGLEHAVRALPAIVEQHPDVLYRIVGATHPNLVALEGERYRESLEKLANDLNVAAHIAWDNRFLETRELLDQLEACDIYLTPYPGLQQAVSGTLSYAVALGKAVVSTPYVHARELLADHVGELIEPSSSSAIATAVNALLDDAGAMAAMQRRAYLRGRETIWPRFADASARLVWQAAPRHVSPAELPDKAPEVQAVLAMSDGTGMLQHSIGIVPDRSHGYCLDDNARALMLMNLADTLDPYERSRTSLIYAAFVQSAWNPIQGRFRNFMNFDRSWCEDEGSEDSNGRALWALGHTIRRSQDEGLALWARHLYDEVITAVSHLQSPRAAAFVTLGACEILAVDREHDPSHEAVSRGGEFLMRLLGGARRPDWAWFEAVLGYDNPRLSQALVEAGRATGNRQWLEAGLETLEWICHQQVSTRGQFRPIGSESFHRAHDYLPFDQQPLEAQAAIEAASSAWRATSRPFWKEHAIAAWRWFLGENDRNAVLGDLISGRCKDGVTPRGANANCGAESILAFQFSHYAIMDMVTSSNARSGEGGLIEPARERLV